MVKRSPRRGTSQGGVCAMLWVLNLISLKLKTLQNLIFPLLNRIHLQSRSCNIFLGLSKIAQGPSLLAKQRHVDRGAQARQSPRPSTCGCNAPPAPGTPQSLKKKGSGCVFRPTLERTGHQDDYIGAELFSAPTTLTAFLSQHALPRSQTALPKNALCYHTVKTITT